MKTIVYHCMYVAVCLEAEARFHLHIDPALAEADLHVRVLPGEGGAPPGPRDGLPLDAGAPRAF